MIQGLKLSLTHLTRKLAVGLRGGRREREAGKLLPLSLPQPPNYVPGKLHSSGRREREDQRGPKDARSDQGSKSVSCGGSCLLDALCRRRWTRA